MITSDSAWLVCPLASAFLVSPHRLDPPCMLGMFKTATPSRDRPLRSSGVPQHWRRNRCQRQGKALVHRVVVGTVLSFFSHYRNSFNDKIQDAHLQCSCLWCCVLTSIVRLSLSFLQEAEMVSEVANSKYHSLFFILQSWKSVFFVVVPFRLKWYFIFTHFSTHSFLDEGGIKLQRLMPQTSAVTTCIQFFFFSFSKSVAADRKNKSKTDNKWLCFVVAQYRSDVKTVF